MSLWDRTDNIILEWVYETGQIILFWNEFMRQDNLEWVYETGQIILSRLSFFSLRILITPYLQTLLTRFEIACTYVFRPPSPHIIQVSKPWYKWLGSLVNILKTYIVQRWSTCFYCFTCIWELKELWKNTFVCSSSKKTENKKLHWRFIRTIDISVLL
jgi:hypothetical protein